jgi:hypothetical protein
VLHTQLFSLLEYLEAKFSEVWTPEFLFFVCTVKLVIHMAKTQVSVAVTTAVGLWFCHLTVEDPSADTTPPHGRAGDRI